MTERLNIATGPNTAIWPPELDRTHDRHKGFYEGMLDSGRDVHDFAQKMYDARNIAAKESTRLSVRVIAESGILGTLEQALLPSGIRVEAAVPLHGLDGSHVVAYTGWNASERKLPSRLLKLHQKSLEQATDRPRQSSKIAPGLHIEFVDQGTSEAARKVLIPKFAGIYALFGYSEEATEELLLDPANVVAYVRGNDGNVASTAMAAYETPHIDGVDVPLVEVTEAFTAPLYRGEGLYRAVSGRLLEFLMASDSPRVSAIYGEGNAARPRVLSAAHQNGRRFSHYERGAYGITNPSYGILPQAYRIEDGRPDSERLPYNDLVVSYLPLEGTL